MAATNRDDLLPARLKEARLQRGMTLEGVADALETSFTTIWRYEAGQRQPSGSTLYALASLYRKPVEWFFEDSPSVEADAEVSDRSFMKDIDVIMSEPELMLRSLKHELSDEAIRSIANFIRFTHEEERGKS